MILSVIDFETTGLNPTNDSIIEIAAFKIELTNSRIIRDNETTGFYRKVVPTTPISEEVAKLNGYHPNEWSDAVPCQDAIEEFNDWVKYQRYVTPNQDIHWTGCNPWFDLQFYLAACSGYNIASSPEFHYRPVDVGSMALPFLPPEMTASLRDLRRWAGCTGQQLHRAYDDVNDTIAVIRQIFDVSLKIKKKLTT